MAINHGIEGFGIAKSLPDTQPAELCHCISQVNE